MPKVEAIKRDSPPTATIVMLYSHLL